MNVSLTPELGDFVRKQVESGLYTTASEVVREGIRLLRERKELNTKRQSPGGAKIERGWQESRRGEVVDGHTAMAEVKKRVKNQGSRQQ